ncbi:hypothetical protein Y1Q_0018509 [Alligator mississippiensis]|uniref:Peptidase S1 domain-containing protein n=1 Tax=Alligator mississippiensis TaxID=8496 RepID=A0A151NDQ7_ALLMI|nr:hypothetical protein Y1Q_0018509 [Alligator mississippiensis]
MRMGDYSLSKNEGTEQCITSAKAFPHPNYNSNTHDSDIMLLKLANPIHITEYVDYVNISTACPALGISCLVSGWGTTDSPEAIKESKARSHHAQFPGLTSMFLTHLIPAKIMEFAKEDSLIEGTIMACRVGT